MSKRPRWIPILLSLFTLTYLNMVVSNIVSYRQREYSSYLKSQNMTLMPLQDVLYTDWFPVYRIPYVDKIGLLVCVDILTVLWALGGVLCWCMNGNHLQPMAELLCVEMLLLPAFGLCQWFTVIPDSLPNCLATNNIPTEGYDWIWYRLGRACGDMIWSSDMVQVMLFLKLYIQSTKMRCCKNTMRCIGVCFIALFMSIALSARYQYSTDLFITMFVTIVVSTHGLVPKISKFCFVRRAHVEVSDSERKPLTI